MSQTLRYIFSSKYTKKIAAVRIVLAESECILATAAAYAQGTRIEHELFVQLGNVVEHEMQHAAEIAQLQEKFELTKNEQSRAKTLLKCDVTNLRWREDELERFDFVLVEGALLGLDAEHTLLVEHVAGVLERDEDVCARVGVAAHGRHAAHRLDGGVVVAESVVDARQHRLEHEPGEVDARRGLVAYGEAFAREHVGIERGKANDARAELVLEVLDKHGRVAEQARVGATATANAATSRAALGLQWHVLDFGQLALAEQLELERGAVVARHDHMLFVGARLGRLEDHLERERVAFAQLEHRRLDLERRHAQQRQ